MEGNKNKPKPYPVLQQLPRPMNFSSWVTPYDNLTDGYWHLLATQNLHFPSTHSLPKTSTTEVVSKTTSPLCGPWSFAEHWKLNPSRRLPIRKPSRVDQIVATLSCQDEKISKLGLINVNICELPIFPLGFPFTFVNWMISDSLKFRRPQHHVCHFFMVQFRCLMIKFSCLMINILD